MPNPPVPFVGRQRELARLARAVEVGPLCVVSGSAGIGKTALLCSFLNGLGAARLKRTLYVSIPPGLPSDDVRLAIGRALFRARALDDTRWASAAADPDALTAVCLDLAESDGWWVVLEDADHADAESCSELIRIVARYAHRSRWFVSGRQRLLVPELAGQVIDLPPLSEVEMERLLAERDGELASEQRRQILERAEGVPRKLLQSVAAAQAGLSLEVNLLDSLSGEARALVLALSEIETALPEALLENRPVLAKAAAELRERGLCEPTPSALKPSAAARELGHSAEPTPNPALELALADALSGASDDELFLAGLRLLARRGRSQAVVELLDARGEQLIQAGYGGALWRVLKTVGEDDAGRWRLRAAIEAGSTQDLATLSEPKQAELKDQLLWSRALFSRGQIDESLRLAQIAALEAQRAGDAALSFSAGLTHAVCLANLSRWKEAIAVFAALTPPNADAAARRDVLMARCYTLAGLGAEAITHMEKVRQAFDSLSPETRSETANALAGVLFDLGRTQEAADALTSVDRDAGGRPPALYSEQGRYGLFQSATLALNQGNIDACREVLATLWPFVGKVSMLRPHMLLAEATCRLFSGEFENLEATFRDVAEHARRIGSQNLGCVAETWLLRLAVAHGRAKEAAERDVSGFDPSGMNGRLLRLYHAQSRLRAGLPVARSEFEVGERLRDYSRLRVAAQTVDAEAQLIGGDAVSALARAHEAVQLASEFQLGLWLASALLLRAEIFAILARPEGLRRGVEELEQLADEMPSTRLAADAEFFAVLVRKGPPDFATLARLAASPEHSPVTARRARALLGDLAPLDALDELVVAAARRCLHPIDVERVRREHREVEWRRAWGMLDPERSVWLPGGRSVDLSRRELLWKLLAVVADGGGSADKEALVLKAWGERDYHPLRHDNRLQAAVRKLRRAIEDDPSNPTRLVTTAEGYAFGDPLLRWHGA